ncbi:MAG: alkaline phosphatase family protein [bacterium]
MKKILLLISLFVLSGALSPAWGKVSTAKTVKKEVAPSSVASRHAILLVLDGVRAQDLYPLLEGGRLPHLKKLFVEEGARFEKATSVFPSTSVSGHQSFFTGLMAGNSGTPQLEWYNAATGEHIDYLTRQGVKHIDWDLFNDRLLTQPDFPVEVDRLAFTLFGLLNPDPTLSVYEIVTAGATEKTHHLPLEALWPGLVSKRFENIDHLAMKTFLKVLKEKSAENFPRFASIALYTGDFIEHEEGADTERMRDAMKQLDASWVN